MNADKTFFLIRVYLRSSAANDFQALLAARFH